MSKTSPKRSAGASKRESSQDRLFADDETCGRISAIEPLEADPNLRRVRVNGKSRVTLRATDIELLRLRVGMEWTEALSQRVEAALAKLTCHTLAMKLLGKRDFSRAELITRLEKHGHQTTIATDVAQELARSGWINDARRAESIARLATRGRPASKRLLIDKMAARGIDSNLAQATAAALGADNELDSAINLAKAKLKSLASSNRATATRRIAGLLARRGFDEDVIAQALDRIGLGGDDASGSADAGDDD